MATPIEGIIRNITLSQEKINHLERALLLETNPGAQFSIEQQLKEAREMLENLKAKLKQIQSEEPQTDKSTSPKTTEHLSWKKQKEELEERVTLGEIDTVFTTLKELLKDRRQRNTLLQLMANYNMIRQQDMNGTVSQDHIDLSYRRARHGLLSFIESLEERHLEG